MRNAMVIGARVLAVIAVALTAGVLVATGSAASTSSAAAPGGPGAQSYLDLARKDCFATARNTTSKVWFTVADGVLSDTFSPTIENSNVNTLQYVVTDGRSFTDMQQRDMTYTVSSPDRSGMVCQVTSRDREARLCPRHRLPDGPGPRQRGHAHDARAAPRHGDRGPTPPEGLRALRRADRQHRRGRSDQCASQQRGHLPGHARAGVLRHHRPHRPMGRAGRGCADRQPQVRARVERLRRHTERRPDAARHLPPAAQRLRLSHGRERRADGADQRPHAPVHARARIRVRRRTKPSTRRNGARRRRTARRSRPM